MNKFRELFFVLVLTLGLSACNENMDGRYNGRGTLSLGGLSTELNAELNTRAGASTEEYFISVLNEENDPVHDVSGRLLENIPLSALKDGNQSFDLFSGNYSVVARTAREVPVTGFDCPVYGGAVPVTVVAGERTAPEVIVCKLLQCKVTIEYDEKLLADMTGAGNAKVEVTKDCPLDFPILFENGVPVPDSRAGYFAIPSASSSMVLTITTVIKGKSMKMSRAFSGIQAAQWRQITLIPMTNPEGNATFDVRVDGYVDDADLLSYSFSPVEDVIGADPKAPAGDGGITLGFAQGCTMFDDLSHIVIPDPAVTRMDLRLVAEVPNGVKKFTVHIDTENEAFKSALAVAGGPDIDLINPSPDAGVVFEVVPFPHGAELAGMTRVEFDLSGAQDPIYAFKGSHTFLMSVMDGQGCKKVIPVVMVIGE